MIARESVSVLGVRHVVFYVHFVQCAILLLEGPAVTLQYRIAT